MADLKARALMHPGSFSDGNLHAIADDLDALNQGLSSEVAALDFSTLAPVAGVTSGSVITTGTTWVDFATAGATGIKLLLSSSAASGDFATMRLRARSNGTGNVIAANCSASAGQNNYGNLMAVQGYAQPNTYTQADASNIVCGLYSCVDMGGATQSGRAWSLWVDTHVATKAAAGDYLARFSHNGTIASDGLFTVYSGGRLPQLFNFEDVSGFLSTSSSGNFTKTHKVAVKIAGDNTQYYMQLGTIA